MRPTAHRALILLAALAAVPPVRAPAAETPPPGGKVLPALVERTALVVLRPDGRRVEGEALVGAVVVGGDPERGGRAAFRIDGLRPDPDDPEITLYDLVIRDPATGEWKPYCVPDARGVAGALFLAGSWDARTTHLRDDKFSVGCTSGALGKCVQAGYKPWETMADGRSGWDYHQACTRLIRADYCGDGRGQTREGVRVEIIDRVGQAEEPGTDLAFEAGWTPGGRAAWHGRGSADRRTSWPRAAAPSCAAGSAPPARSRTSWPGPRCCWPTSHRRR